ncbi:MAG: hypothetical protein GY851_03675 [bacterium]|nr:hypothetical protein [bacterium]
MPLNKLNGLEVLELRGSPEEMGAEHGTLMRDRIQHGIEHFLKQSDTIFDVSFELLSREAKRCEPFIPHPYIQEMKAIAAHSGVPYDDILALNCLVDVDGCHTQGILQCCNFVVSPPATRDGMVIHGRNLDFPHGGVIPGMAITVVRRPAQSDALPTLGVTWVGFAGMLTGCNAAQLSAAEVGCPAKDSALDGMPIPFLIRDALERSHSAEAFFERLRGSRRTCGFNLAVCDGKTGDALGIEFTHSLCERRPARKGVLVVDDVCFCKKTAANRLCYPAGAFRHARAMHLAGTYRGAIDVDTALGFLRDRYDMAHAVHRGVGYNCLCNRHTVHSVLFLPAENRVLIAHGEVPAPTGVYREVDLARLW